MTRCAVISHGALEPICPFLDGMLDEGWGVTWLPLTPVAWVPEGVEVCPPVNSKLVRSTLGKVSYLLGIRRLRSLLRDLSPDFVWAHYASSAGFLASVAGVHPFAVSVYGSDLYSHLKSQWGRALLKRTFSRADAVSLWGSAMEDPVVGLGAPRESCIVGHTGVDLSMWEFQEIPPPNHDELRVLCARRLEWVYDIPTVLRAVASVRESGRPIRATFSAGGSLAYRMKRLAYRLGVEEVVEFREGSTQQELLELFRSHHVYISASRWDGTSTTLLEALAAGVFPIVSRIPANEEWIDHGRNGLFFGVGDFRALSDLLMGFWEKGPMIESARIENRQRILDRADRRKVLPQLLRRVRDVALGIG